MRAYLAAISFADKMVGQVIAALDRSAQNTVAVFWSDNGWHLGEECHWHKSTLWQRSTHVPINFCRAGRQRHGHGPHAAGEPARHLPTLHDLCGLPKREGLDGTSLPPLLRDVGRKWKPAASTFEPDNHAVIAERRRYNPLPGRRREAIRPQG